MPAPASAPPGPATSFRCRPAGSSRRSRTADGLIVGSPVYKGAYTGLFKHLFDLVDPGALAGKPVAIVATGGGARHALVVEHAFRPLFGFFGALQMPDRRLRLRDRLHRRRADRARRAGARRQAGGQLAALLGRRRAASAPAALAAAG